MGMDYGVIKTREQLKALKRVLEKRMKRIQVEVLFPDERTQYAIDAMKRELDEVMRELAMRKMFGKKWRDK